MKAEVCFVDPHFVVASPDFVYIGGGNLLEFDYVVFKFDGVSVFPVVYEDTSRAVEPFVKSLRYVHYLSRFIPIFFAAGRAAPGGVGFATAVAGSVVEVLGVDEGELRRYREAVGWLYTYFPDNAHVNFFVITSSGEYLRELAEDLAEAGRALRRGYRFLGLYLEAKGEALLGRCPRHLFGEVYARPEVPCFPRALCVDAEEAVAFAPVFRDAKLLEDLYVLLLKGLADGVLVVDGDVRHPSACVRCCGVDVAPERRYVILRDYDKKGLDRYIERAWEVYGGVYIVYIPEYVYVYESCGGGGGRAPVPVYLLPPKSLGDSIEWTSGVKEWGNLWQRYCGDGGYWTLPDCAPPYLFAI